MSSPAVLRPGQYQLLIVGRCVLCMQARLAATAGADFYSITEDSARVDSRGTIPFQFSYRCDAGGHHESILNTDVLLLRGIVPVCRPAVHNEGLQADSSWLCIEDR